MSLATGSQGKPQSHGQDKNVIDDLSTTTLEEGYIEVGCHRGKRFRDVLLEDPKYSAMVLATSDTSVQAFLRYLQCLQFNKSHRSTEISSECDHRGKLLEQALGECLELAQSWGMTTSAGQEHMVADQFVDCEESDTHSPRGQHRSKWPTTFDANATLCRDIAMMYAVDLDAVCPLQRTYIRAPEDKFRHLQNTLQGAV